MRGAVFGIAPAAAMLVAAPAWSSSTRVSDIRIDGLQRISAGTVFTYLPIERGDTADAAKTAEAIRALYKTGFFQDIRVHREREILVITVVERPAINKLQLNGNKDIKNEDLLKGLQDIGLREGDTFDPLSLDRVTQELVRQYNNRGKYNVEITPSVRSLERNRVDITIEIKEGKAAKIHHINLVGNDTFDEETLRSGWESRESNWLSWYSRDNQYSREKLSGDLERLNSYYLDRGHIDFSVDSTQVSLDAQKLGTYITASVTEGKQYTVSEVRLTGNTVLPQGELEKRILLHRGQIFSRRLLEMTSDSIVASLGNIGYAFAEVDVVPDLNRTGTSVGVSLNVVPGPRVSVKRIRFKGNVRTSDEVLRREMRQFEGSWYSQAALDRSKLRLQALGFFESVDIAHEAVPEAPDQVDVVVSVREAASGQFQFGIGYSQDLGLTLQLQINERNFLGLGRPVSIIANRSSTTEQYSFAFSEPHLTSWGMGLGYRLSWARTYLDSSDSSSYDSQQAAIGLSATVPLSETNSLQIGTSLDSRTLDLVEGYYPPSQIEFVDRLGDGQADTWTLTSNWARDTRNEYFSPTAGTLHRLSAEVALPGSDVSYYRLTYDLDSLLKTGPLVTRGRFEFGYGDSYNGGSEAVGYPFYRNFYAGGPGSLRTFEANTLGPCEYVPYYDSCRPTGGAVKLLSGLEFSIPGLMSAKGARLSAFIDAGNVFSDLNSIEFEEIRASAGLSLLWRSPMGPISISYGTPLKSKDGDEIERLQFTFGNQF